MGISKSLAHHTLVISQGSRLCPPSHDTCYGSAVPPLFALPSHTRPLDIDLMESPMGYPRGFLQRPGGFGTCPSASALPVGVHAPASKHPTSCCLLTDFMPCSPFFSPISALLFTTFTSLSPPGLLPNKPPCYPYFATTISKCGVSDTITYAITALNGINDMVS